MDKRAKDKLVRSPTENGSSLKNWKGREEREAPGKDGKKKKKEVFKCWE